MELLDKNGGRSRGHQRLRPARDGSSVRERVTQFEMDWGVKHTVTVEVPYVILGGRQQGRWYISISVRPWMLNSRQSQSRLHIGEMVVSAGDHKLKVVVFVEGAEGGESIFDGRFASEGKAAAQECEVEPPSKRRKTGTRS